MRSRSQEVTLTISMKYGQAKEEPCTRLENQEENTSISSAAPDGIQIPHRAEQPD